MVGDNGNPARTSSKQRSAGAAALCSDEVRCSGRRAFAFSMRLRPLTHGTPFRGASLPAVVTPNVLGPGSSPPPWRPGDAPSATASRADARRRGLAIKSFAFPGFNFGGNGGKGAGGAVGVPAQGPRTPSPSPAAPAAPTDPAAPAATTTPQPAWQPISHAESAYDLPPCRARGQVAAGEGGRGTREARGRERRTWPWRRRVHRCVSE